MSAAAAASGQDLAQLRILVAEARARFEEWAELVDQPWLTDVAVVIDEAEELRRQFHAAAGCARGLLMSARQAAPTALTVTSAPPATLGAAAAALDAAGRAIRPVSTGLGGDTQLTRIAQASYRATRRILDSARHDLEDLAVLSPTVSPVSLADMGHAPSHLRLIDSGISRA